ncbi:protein kinase [Spirillospora sp. NPDC048911]|uniref:serine/threonine-protein kinase n=1 Tax=Spirillospora sp. NPDC048911 TaxID=3364527 RepID=UPI003716D267
MGSTPLYLADRYRLYEQIGTGRVATVWLAWDEVLDRLVAVKVVRDSMAAVPVFRARFLEQVRKAARLSHPAIVTIHDFGESGQPDGVPLPFVVMELLSGETLATRLGQGPLPQREALDVCGQVASALAYAHAAGAAHHDLKPSSVLFTDGGPKIVGFGTGEVIGGPIDAAAGDVRALGLLLSAAVTGRADAESSSAVPFEVAAVHVRCLLPDPAARPSAAEVAAVLAGPRRAAVPGGAGTLARRAHRAVRRRSRVLRHTVVLLSALALVALTALVLQSDSAERALPPPRMEATAPSYLSGAAAASADPSPSPSPTHSTTESPSASATPAPDPTPSATPKPTRRARPTRPAPAPHADPAEVLSRAQRAVDAGVAAGEIRSDVGLDLNNVLGNLRRDLQQNPTADLRAGLTAIHNKIDTRLGERAITPSRAGRLHAILNEIRT